MNRYFAHLAQRSSLMPPATMQQTAKHPNAKPPAQQADIVTESVEHVVSAATGTIESAPATAQAQVSKSDLATPLHNADTEKSAETKVTTQPNPTTMSFEHSKAKTNVGLNDTIQEQASYKIIDPKDKDSVVSAPEKELFTEVTKQHTSIHHAMQDSSMHDQGQHVTRQVQNNTDLPTIQTVHETVTETFLQKNILTKPQSASVEKTAHEQVNHIEPLNIEEQHVFASIADKAHTLKKAQTQINNMPLTKSSMLQKTAAQPKINIRIGSIHVAIHQAEAKVKAPPVPVQVVQAPSNKPAADNTINLSRHYLRGW